jgi:hypothetical protein
MSRGKDAPARDTTGRDRVCPGRSEAGDASSAGCANDITVPGERVSCGATFRGGCRTDDGIALFNPVTVPVTRYPLPGAPGSRTHGQPPPSRLLERHRPRGRFGLRRTPFHRRVNAFRTALPSTRVRRADGLAGTGECAAVAGDPPAGARVSRSPGHGSEAGRTVTVCSTCAGTTRGVGSAGGNQAAGVSEATYRR